MGASGKLYETDPAAWASDQAELLRAKRWDEVDVENVAEEIEDVARSERREVRSRLVILLAQLATRDAQPGRRGVSWESTIAEQRVQIESALDESPSLRPGLADLVAAVWPRAVVLASKQSQQSQLPRGRFPESCPWPLDQVLDSDFLPGG